MPGSGVGCRREPGLGGARCERDGWRRRRAPGLPASTGHARFANPNAAISAAGIHFAAPPPAAWPAPRRWRRNRVRRCKWGGPENGDSGNRPDNPRMDRHSGRAPHRALPDQRCGAASLRAAIRLETRSGSLPDDVLLHFAGAGKEIFEASGKDLSVNRPYWSPVIEGDTLTVELVLPANLQPGDLRLSVPQVSYFADSCTRPATATASAPAAAARWMRSARPRAARGPTTTPPQRWRRWSSPARRTAAATSAPAPC